MATTLDEERRMTTTASPPRKSKPDAVVTVRELLMEMESWSYLLFPVPVGCSDRYCTHLYTAAKGTDVRFHLLNGVSFTGPFPKKALH